MPSASRPCPSYPSEFALPADAAQLPIATVDVLAAAARLGAATVQRAETAGRGVPPITAATLAAIETALRQAGIEFIEPGQPSVGGALGEGSGLLPCRRPAAGAVDRRDTTRTPIVDVSK